MMCARLLRPKAGRTHLVASARWSERAYHRDGRIGYGGASPGDSRHGLIVMLVLLVTVCLNVYPVRDHSEGLLPAAGYGSPDRAASRPTRASPFQAMRVKLADFMDDRQPAILPSRTSSASPAARSATRATMFVALKPIAERKRSADQVIARLRPQARQGAGRQPVPAAGAGHPHRRPAGQRAIPVHAAGGRPRASCAAWEPKIRAGALLNLAELGRRQHRPRRTRGCRRRW